MDIKEQILIIDDDAIICKTYKGIIEKMGHSVECALSLESGLKKIHKSRYALVLLDVMLPDGNGLDKISTIHESAFNPEVIIVTAMGDPDGAVLAMKNNAWGYIEKSDQFNKMQLAVTRALEYQRQKQAARNPLVFKRDRIIGSSAKLKFCLDRAACAAGSDANVLLVGETGTGKELMAQSIHENSNRSSEEFVVVDCAAIPENLAESVLFGHMKGVFTGADSTREGLIEQADGGTLFLDEMGELPLTIQKKLLRALQERRFRPIGSKNEKESNFRLISATNHDLEAMVEEGAFRSDLLHRIQTFKIELPPLRERENDICELTDYFVRQFCKRPDITRKEFSIDFFDTLGAYDWPGNIRELYNTIEASMITSSNAPVLYPQHLPPDIRANIARNRFEPAQQPQTDTTVGDANLSGLSYKTFRDRSDQQYFQALVQRYRGNLKAAIKISGLSRSRFYAIIKKFNLSEGSL